MMRPLLIASLITLASTLFVVAIQRSGRPRFSLLFPVIPVIPMTLQVAIEGYRWRMVPAYALGAIVLLIGLLPASAAGRREP
jgi:hypothetical protein